MKKIAIHAWDKIKPLEPVYALIATVDLVIVRWKDEDKVSVMFGRCLHRGALMSDGHIDGDNLICGLHNWDYAYKTGISSYNPSERLQLFSSWLEDGQIMVDEDEIRDWAVENPQPYDRQRYQGLYQDLHGSDEEPHSAYIQHLAEHGLGKLGHHGRMAAMGVPRDQLPAWDDIQMLTAQLHQLPLLDDAPVQTQTIIGPKARKPLVLKRPLLVSDMSFGALSEEAKVALAMGAELARTAICSGEGGMLPEEQAVNSHYMYELVSARFGYAMQKVQQCQAFHFKCGQGAKTGTGGHLPGSKVQGKIAKVRGLAEGSNAISPSRFPDWQCLDDYRQFADQV